MSIGQFKMKNLMTAGLATNYCRLLLFNHSNQIFSYNPGRYLHLSCFHQFQWNSFITDKFSCCDRPGSQCHKNLQKSLVKHMLFPPVCFYGNKGKHVKEKSSWKHTPSDSDFMAKLYVNNGNKDSAKAQREEYYKQAWLGERTNLTEDQFTTEIDKGIIRHKNDSKPLPENVYGIMEEGLYKSQGDHNERIEKLIKEDDTERDWRKNIPLTKYGRKGKTAYAYNKEMFRLASEGKIKEAIAIFDKNMLTWDRARPTKRTFITLISILGKVGYTRKAFQLFRQMKYMGLDPPNQVYTSLFNSCANCPMPEYGLNRANNLYHHMKDIGVTPTLITVKASMRAFALCGDFAKAFQILDETNLPLDSGCFDALLMACIADKEAGFKRALQVWLLMREHHIKPEGTTYDLLAHCLRDCGIGDPHTFLSDLRLSSGLDNKNLESTNELTDSCGGSILESPQLLGSRILPLAEDQHLADHRYHHNKSDEISSSRKNSFDFESDKNVPMSLPLKNEDGNVQKDRRLLNNIETSYSMITEGEPTQNQMASHAMSSDTLTTFKQDVIDSENNISPTSSVKNQSLIQISDLNTRPGRLALLGGMESFVSHMQSTGVEPNIRTFTLMLSSLPNDAESELQLLNLMERLSIPTDIDCLNDIMMRRNMRHQSDTVKEILPIISRKRLVPNMRTYAALALTCHHEQDAIRLLNHMKLANLEPTVEVLSHLIYISRINFKYKLSLLTLMEDLRLQPTERIIRMIEKSIALTKERIIQAEKNTETSTDLKRFVSLQFQDNFRRFLRFYRPWLQRTELAKQRHPWEGLEEKDTTTETTTSD